MDFDLDRYDRQKRIAGWNQEKIRKARVLVVGAGALGNEVVKMIAQLGVGRITIIDFDFVIPANLNRCVLFEEIHAKNKTLKIDAVAESVKKLNKDCIVEGFNKKVEDLSEDFFKGFDLVFGCLDNLSARLHVNANCYGVVPFIDGGTDGFNGRVQFIFKNACLECTVGKTDFTNALKRFSCSGEKKEIEEDKIPALPTTTSIIAGIQVQGFLKFVLTGVLDDYIVFYDGITNKTSFFEVEKSKKCNVHF
jgi:molybdopterin/thiamine biosynthesis adenylyltransferase